MASALAHKHPASFFKRLSRLFATDDGEHSLDRNRYNFMVSGFNQRLILILGDF